MAKLPVKARLRNAKNRLSRVESVLNKRIARIAYCKAKQAYWKRRKGTRAATKVAFWHEQLDKAILGKQEYEKREARLQKKIAYLKSKIPAAPATQGVVTPDRPWNPNRVPVAAWIAREIDKIWAAGWRGVLVSGWRDPVYSEHLCYSMCGAPACPGRCAGRSSRHSGSVYPDGAADVTNYYSFGAYAHQVGSVLHNTLGAQDPVHFSYYGN